MNININDIKNGMTILMDGNLCLIVDFQHVKPGKGTAFVRIKLKNLKTGSITEDTYNTNIKIEKAHIDKKKMQYLYNTGSDYIFMDNNTYDQISVPESKLKEEIKYLKENMEITISYFNNEIIGVDLPEKMEYVVTETSAAVKGNTTTNAMKDAKVETGYTLKVPLFINEGDTIIISTRDGKYNGRA